MANKVKIVLNAKSTGAAALVKELVELMPGVTTGSIEVSFQFSADKGEDEQYTAVQELCPWTVVALLMSKVNGMTQQVVIDCIPQVMAMSDAQRKLLRENLKDSTTARLEEMGLFVQRTRTGKTRIEVQGDGEMTV
jgi:hypothetical protein